LDITTTNEKKTCTIWWNCLAIHHKGKRYDTLELKRMKFGKRWKILHY